MKLGRLATVALVAGALAATATPAAATCFIGQIDICDKPTDPYTEPGIDPVVDTVVDILVSPPVGPVVGTVFDVYAEAYETALCAVQHYWSCLGGRRTRPCAGGLPTRRVSPSSRSDEERARRRP